MRWVPAALLVALTATACSGGDADPAAVASTPAPTPSSELLDGMEAPAGLRPATTSSPTAALFEWVEFVDEGSRTSAALPEDAERISNTIAGPDGAPIETRGYVFEHAGGVIGFELIDEFATVDDLEKLADLLATSVGGAVVASEEVDGGRGRGADGEIVYGDDQVMLFRILVLNSNGDVWSGFVGGPETERERLESEFTRLTVSADLSYATDWVRVVDEPSGLVVDLPQKPETREHPGGRDYFTPSVSAGFIVIDRPGAGFDAEAELASLAESVEAAVVGSEPYELLGYPGIEGEFRAEDTQYLARIVLLEEHVLVLISAGHQSYPHFNEERLDGLSASVVLP